MAPSYPVVKFPQVSVIPPRNLFVCGLHRSGTTLITDTIAQHPAIASLKHDKGPENEGEFLQSVLSGGNDWGGPGRFAFAPQSHLTEASPLATEETARAVMAAWAPYHQPDRPWLVEKSPCNLLRMRLLQALYPQAKFVIVMRHPIAVSLATQKWTHTSPFSLMAHWLRAYQIAADDLPHLRDTLVVRYEDFVASPHENMDRIWQFLELPSHRVEIKVKNSNQRYFARWQQELEASRAQRQRELAANNGLGARLWKKLKYQPATYKRMSRLIDGQRSDLISAVEAFEISANRFGYSLIDPPASNGFARQTAPSAKAWTAATETLAAEMVAWSDERQRAQQAARTVSPSATAVVP